MERKRKIIIPQFLLMLFAIFLTVTGCSKEPAKDSAPTSTTSVPVKTVVRSKVNDKKYQLQKVVVLSRHNVRAPLSTKGSDLSQLTPHKWINWSSDAGELSLRGGDLETLMGQYFRKYLIKKKLFVENEQPTKESVRFYANSMQRTIATAQYFSSGFLPVANVDIEHHYKIGTMDPVFSPQLTFVNKKFKQKSLIEITKMGGTKDLSGIEKQLESNYKLLAQVLDLKNSEKAKKTGYTKFPTNDLKINFKLHEEPTMTGSLQVATTAADALVLQYYEEPNATKASFGKKLSYKQWEKIAHIKDVYGNVLFTAPSVAKNVAHPMLKELKSELTNKTRKFSFLCGHDSNIASVLAAMKFKTFELPRSIEKTTPIGSKIVMEQWKNKKGQEFVTFKMVYFSVQQLRHLKPIDLKNPPMIFDLSLKDKDKNSDGMYSYNDVINQFTKAIDAYDKLAVLNK